MNWYTFYWYATDILKSATPFAVGAGVVYLAFRQWKTNHTKLKFDLFDRRYKIYWATEVFVHQSACDDIVDVKHIVAFSTAITEAEFLFPPDLVQFLKDLKKKTLEGRSVARHLDHSIRAQDSQSVQNYSDKQVEITSWLEREAATIIERFRPYLMLHKIK